MEMANKRGTDKELSLTKRVQFQKNQSRGSNQQSQKVSRANRYAHLDTRSKTRSRSRSMSLGPTWAEIVRKSSCFSEPVCSPPSEKKRRKYKEMPEFDFSQPISSFKQLDKMPTSDDAYRNLDCRVLLKDIYKDVWKDIVSHRCQNKDMVNYQELVKKTKNQVGRIQGIHKTIISQRKSEYQKLNPTSVLQQEISSLILCEKVLQEVDFKTLTQSFFIIRLRLKNADMLVSAYRQAGDHKRVIRYLS